MRNIHLWMVICPSYFPHVIVVFMLLRNKRSHQKTSCHNVLLYHTAEAHAMTFLYTAGFQGFPRVLKGVQGTNTWSWLRGKVKQLPEPTASSMQSYHGWYNLSILESMGSVTIQVFARALSWPWSLSHAKAGIWWLWRGQSDRFMWQLLSFGAINDWYWSPACPQWCSILSHAAS